jgi:hypothetical protein
MIKGRSESARGGADSAQFNPRNRPPEIKSNPKRDTSAAADTAAKTEISAKLETQFADFKRSLLSVKGVKTTQAATKKIPEIEALDRQKGFVASVHAQSPVTSSIPTSPASFQVASSAGAKGPILATPIGEPSESLSASSSAQHPTPSTPIGATAGTIVATTTGEPSERQAPSLGFQHPPTGGSNPNMRAQEGAKLCMTAQIFSVNNATSGVVFTQDPTYNDYIIAGCGFGIHGGEVYLSGAVTNGRINMVVSKWGPSQIEAAIKPGLTGVLDGWPDLIVVPAGNPAVKFPNNRFYAQRQSVPLSHLPQGNAHLANIPVNTKNSFGTEYCPGPDELHLFPCIAFNSGPHLSNVANAVDRDGGQVSFDSGEDVYDLSSMTPGFVIDYFSVDWYAWSESICLGWVAEGNEKLGDSINYSTQGHYGWYLKTSSQIAVDWGVDHCAWRWLGAFNVDDEYNSGYSLQVNVKGPIGVDPWTGKPTGP